MQPIRLVIVESHDLTRHGVEKLVSGAPSSITLVGSFPDLAAAQVCLKDQRPNVLLLGDPLPRGGEICAVIQELQAGCPGMSVVVLSSILSVPYIQRLLNGGAQGFICKEDRLGDTLVNGIETVRSGLVYLSPQVAALPYLRDVRRDLGQLNSSDLQVLHLMAQGNTSQEIAERLGMVDRSVYRIRGRLKAALNVRTSEQIVDAAREKGLLDK